MVGFLQNGKKGALLKNDLLCFLNKICFLDHCVPRDYIVVDDDTSSQLIIQHFKLESLEKNICNNIGWFPSKWKEKGTIEKWFIMYFEQFLFFGPLCTTPLHPRRDDNDTSSQLIIILHHCPVAKGKQQLPAWWYSTGSRKFKDNDRILGMI